MKNKFVAFWWSLAILIPVCFIWAPFFIELITDRSFFLHEHALLMALTNLTSSLLLAAPFAIVALWSKKKLESGDPENRRAVIFSGLVVLVLFAALVGWILFDALTRTSGGVNIGAGILLLVLFPVVSPLILVGTYKILKKK